MSSADNDKKICSNPANENIFRVSLLGAEGTGKSCFLAGLAFLGFDPHQALLKIYPQDSETARYLNSLDRAFQNGLFPPPTNITSVLNFNLHLPRSRTVMNILTVDYPGEDFRHAINDVTPERAAQFSSHLLESDIVILLIDVTDVFDGNKEKQAIIREKLRAYLNAAYEAVQHHEKTAKQRNKKIDICIGMTKCDLLPFYQQIIRSSNGGGRIVRQFLNSRWKNFEHILRDGTNIKNIRYFGLSAVGTTDHETGKPVKGQIKPFGYEPMFRWIAERSTRISSRKFKRCCFRFLLITFILLASVLTVCYGQRFIDRVREQDQLAILSDENITVVQKLEQTHFPVTDNVTNQRNSLIDTELNRLKNTIKQTNNEQTLGEIREELKMFDNIDVEERRAELDKLKTEIDNKSIEIEFKRVRDYFDSRNELFSETAEQFLARYPLSVQADEVRHLQKQYENEKIKTERNRIGQIAITNIESLREKSRRIFTFLEKYENRLNPVEASAIKRAAELAKQFTERHNYSVTINQYGGFAYEEKQNVSVYINKDKVVSHYSNGKVKIVSPGTLFFITWQCGDTIRLELQGYGVYDFETAAGYTNSSPISLRCLNQKIRLLPKSAGTWDWGLPKRMSSDGYFIKCTIQDIKDEHWKAFENYIMPGDHWQNAKEE
ncbi:MAG: hypothetical protein LBG58_15600 [Planctomycetaceae bacterium]|jgi:hypothetical protein|nr:hypothetical protein [Planctomycetaceae bacterium]